MKKTLDWTIDPQNSVEFGEHAAAICSDSTIFIIAPKMVLKLSRICLMKPYALRTELFIVFLIQNAHLFIKGAPYTIGFRKIVADDYAELSLRTVKFVRTASTDVATKTSTAFICGQGE